MQLIYWNFHKNARRQYCHLLCSVSTVAVLLLPPVCLFGQITVTPVVNPATVETVYNVKTGYGAKGDGTTDDSTAVQNAITAAYNANGGVVYFPSGTYKLLSQLAINHDSSTPPKQPTIVLVGDGSEWDSRLNSTNLAGNSVIDLRATTTPAKIDTRGLGVLEIKDLSFIDGSTAASPPPFIQTTNTALLITRCSFSGNSTQGGATGVQDGIVLGSTTTNLDGSATAAFQGYGTVIEKVIFKRIRTGVLGQTYCNSVALNDLTFNVSCGGDATHGAIQIDGTVGAATNNTVKGALIEVVNYTYGIVLKNSKYNSFYGVTFWDGTATVAMLGAAQGSIGNQFIGCTINGITDTGTVNDYYYLTPKDRHMYFGTNTGRVDIDAFTAQITTPVFQTLQNTYPPASADANWNTLKLTTAGFGSVLLLGTATGTTHMPFIEARDDVLTLFPNTTSDGTVKIGAAHLYWTDDNAHDIGGYDGTRRPRDFYLARNATIGGTSTLSGGIVGTTTNDSAASGNVGALVSSLVAIGSPQSLSNGTAANVTSISLTAGDWDVDGNVNFTETTSTVTARTAGISTTSATLPTDGSEAYCGVQSTVTSETNSITLPRKRISIASTTTVYLVGKASFSAGTCAGFGAITARRVR